VQSLVVKNLEKNGAHVSVDLEVGQEDMEPFFQEILERLKKQIKIKGFRPGKAPSSLVEQKYGERADAIFIDDFLPLAIQWYNQKNEFRTLENPKVSLKEYVRKQKLHFIAEYDIIPAITLPSYKKANVKEDMVKVETEDIENEIKIIRSRHAELKTKEGQAENGDELVLKVTVIDENGKILEENKVIKTILGDNKQLPDLDKGLKAIKKDESREFKIKYPKDFQESNLAGKVFTFKCVANEINQVILPKVDDDLAKDEGFDSLEALKKNIEEQLEKIGKNILEKRAKESLIEKLTKETKTDIPNSILEEEIRSQINQLKRSKGFKATNLTELESEIEGKDGKKMAEEIKATSALNTRKLLMLIEIAKQEKINVTNEEVDRNVGYLAKHFGMEKEDLYAKFQNDNTLNNISQDLLIQKTIDFVYNLSDKKKGKSIKWSEIKN
jgi:trigger factor